MKLSNRFPLHMSTKFPRTLLYDKLEMSIKGNLLLLSSLVDQVDTGSAVDLDVRATGCFCGILSDKQWYSACFAFGEGAILPSSFNGSTKCQSHGFIFPSFTISRVASLKGDSEAPVDNSATQMPCSISSRVLPEVKDNMPTILYTALCMGQSGDRCIPRSVSFLVLDEPNLGQSASLWESSHEAQTRAIELSSKNWTIPKFCGLMNRINWIPEESHLCANSNNYNNACFSICNRHARGKIKFVHGWCRRTTNNRNQKR